MNAFAKVDKQTFLRFAQEHAGERYEYVRGRIVQQMTAGTRDHGLVVRRITQLMLQQIDEASWQVLNDRGIETPETIRYPDVAIEPPDEPGDSLSTQRPLLLVEVLSPSSIWNDLDVKPAEYFSLPALEAYIVASQDEPACLVWVRGADGAFVGPREVRGRAEVLEITCRAVTLSLPLATIYHGIG